MAKNKDLVGGPVRPEEVTIRISIMMEGDLLLAIKKKAASLNKPYQTYMKEALREMVMNRVEHSGIEAKLDRIEHLLQGSLAASTRLSPPKPVRGASKRTTKKRAVA